MKCHKVTYDFSENFLKLKKIANHLLLSKYYLNKINDYQLFVINNILTNSRCHIVSLFKDYLLFDEQAEFLKRFYSYPETVTKLKKIFYYFKETSFLFPNYTPLKEAKYIYQNIIKKQLVIDKQENIVKKININKKKSVLNHSFNNKINRISLNAQNSENKKNFFDSTIYHDILNSHDSCMSVIFGNDFDKENENEDIKKLIEYIQSIENFTNLRNSKKLKDNKNKPKVLISNVKLSKINSMINSTKKLNQNNPIISNLKFNSNKNLINNSFSKLATATNSVILNNYKQKLFKKNKVISTRTKLKEGNNILNKNMDLNINDNKENHLINNSINKNKIIYHRKVNSTLIGEYLNKIEITNTKINQNNEKTDTFSSINASALLNRISPNFKRNSNLQKKSKLFISTKKFTDVVEKDDEKLNDLNNININIKPKNFVSPSNTSCNLMHSQTEKYLFFNKKNNGPRAIQVPIYTNNINKKYFVIAQKNSTTTRRNIKNELSGMIKNSNSAYFSKINKVKNDISNYNNDKNADLKQNNRTTIFKKGTITINKLNMMNSDKKPLNQKFKSVYFHIGMNTPYSKPKAVYKENSKNKYCFSSQKSIKNYMINSQKITKSKIIFDKYSK